MNHPLLITESALPVPAQCDVLVIGGGPAGPRWRNIRDLGPLAGENIVEAQ